MPEPPSRARDERPVSDEAAHGAEPNEFLATVADRIPRGPVLCICDTDGRNGVWLAERGHAVVAVDATEKGLARARRLAAERGVNLTTVNANLAGYRIPAGYFAGVVSIDCRLARDVRARVHRDAVRGLRPGGAFVLETSTRGRPGHGPDVAATHLMDPDEVRAELEGLVLEIAREVGDRGDDRTDGAVFQVLGFRPDG